MNKLELIHHFALDAAKAGVFTLLALLCLEAAAPGSVARFFNLLWLVTWIVLTSALAFATHHERERKPPPRLWLGLLGLAAAAYAWFALAPIASAKERIAATVVILLMSWLLWPLLAEDQTESES
jgi:hypothetical protein